MSAYVSMFIGLRRQREKWRASERSLSNINRLHIQPQNFNAIFIQSLYNIS
jgi:hypothetical protein